MNGISDCIIELKLRNTLLKNHDVSRIHETSVNETTTNQKFNSFSSLSSMFFNISVLENNSTYPGRSNIK